MNAWLKEPNVKHWIDLATGIECYILRHSQLLHLCGYIAVEPGHPWFGIDGETIEPHPCVHGGLTYSRDHKPENLPDGKWWLGFDCAHLGDLVPGAMVRTPEKSDRYRDMKYVTQQCARLAEQAAAALEDASDMTAHLSASMQKEQDDG